MWVSICCLTSFSGLFDSWPKSYSFKFSFSLFPFATLFARELVANHCGGTAVPSISSQPNSPVPML